jgi:ATP-dependent RNA helicase DDX31/DBP7
MQARMMAVVSDDKKMQKSARDAFQSYVGAYATHASHLKSIFHVRKLHLGHVAHSFALKAQPTAVGKSQGKRKSSQGKGAGHSKDGSKKKRRKDHDTIAR